MKAGERPAHDSSLCDGSSEGRHTALVGPTGQDGNLSEHSVRHEEGWQGEGLRTGSLMLCGYSASPESIGTEVTCFCASSTSLWVCTKLPEKPTRTGCFNTTTCTPADSCDYTISQSCVSSTILYIKSCRSVHVNGAGSGPLITPLERKGAFLRFCSASSDRLAPLAQPRMHFVI